MSGYFRLNRIRKLPRLPLAGGIDLGYRCNNHCRHCWIWLPEDSKEKERELTLQEIMRIVDEARNLGCKRWCITGGEPLLRPDFAEIFDHITRNSVSYSMNTNGTLMTPKIAGLMKRKGFKMISLYGSTADVYDRITRAPGSFEAAMQGFRYLREAGAGFCVQIIPMRDNYHQLAEMVELAKSLSRHYRVGAAWLFLSGCGDAEMNNEIIRQRLPTEEAVKLDKPDLACEDRHESEEDAERPLSDSNGLFGRCVATRNGFHIDAYGRMSLCCYIKDPSLRYDLRKG